MKKMSAVLLSGLLASQMVWAETGKKDAEIFGATLFGFGDGTAQSNDKEVWAGGIGGVREPIKKPVYQLTSHVLDINSGIPAANVKIELKKWQAGGSWKLLDTKYTNDNGRIPDFLPKTDGNDNANDGTYKLVFHTADYYGKLNVPTFYPYVEVAFNIKGGKHYHVPITLSPFGYSTYRGS